MPMTHLQRAFQADRHQHLGSHAQRPQVMRQLIGAAVQLPIGQLLSLEHDGDGIGRSLDLRLEEPMNARSPADDRSWYRSTSPAACRRSASVKSGKSERRCSGSATMRLQQGLKIPQHPGDRAGLEQVGVVDECGRQPLIGVRDLQCQIEVRRLAVSLDGAQRQARQLHRPAVPYCAGRTSPGRADCGSDPALRAIPRPAGRRAGPDGHRLRDIPPAPAGEAPGNWDCRKGRYAGPAR